MQRVAAVAGLSPCTSWTGGKRLCPSKRSESEPPDTSEVSEGLVVSGLVVAMLTPTAQASPEALPAIESRCRSAE